MRTVHPRTPLGRHDRAPRAQAGLDHRPALKPRASTPHPRAILVITRLAGLAVVHRRAILVIAGLASLAVVSVGFWRFTARVSALAARHAAGPAWSFPSRVYSDDVPLTVGRSLPEPYLLAHLEARGYRSALAAELRPGTFAKTHQGYEIFLRGFLEAPDPNGTGGPERVRLRLASGRLAGLERLEGWKQGPSPDLTHPPRLEPVEVAVLWDSRHVRRTWIPLARIPVVVRDAVIAAEDRRFRRHFGVDLVSNLRALVTNVGAGEVRQGGSTITQQLARGLFLGRERTWMRKLKEMMIASGLELAISKDQILEMYLNSVYWGRGAQGGEVAGVAEAARAYFDAPVESLDVRKAALLAGIIPAPNVYSPFRHPALARARRDAVLADLVATRVLDPKTAAKLRRDPIQVRAGRRAADRFPSFADHVREDLEGRLPAGAAEQWGLSVFTTLDLVWQRDAEAGLADGIETLERSSGRRKDPLQGAFVALDPGSGAIRCMVGGRAAVRGDFNRVTQAKRQPGSAIKPLVYAAALDPTRLGPRFTPATTVPNLRRTFPTPEGPWSPRNDEADYHPQVTLAKALAKSLNVATANLVEAIGPAEVARYLERFGLGRPKAVASIGLGSNEVTLLALTSAYSAFVHGGGRWRPTPVRAVTDSRGKPLLAGSPDPVRAVPRETAALMTGLLEDVVIFGVSYPLRARYGFTRPTGGKTGTTNDYNDAWFVGFTPDVVAGVWVGYDAPASLRRPAAETALPVWAGIMERLLGGFPAIPFPTDRELDLKWIDPWTGGLAGPRCPRTMRVPFLPGTAPRNLCGRDHTADWLEIEEQARRDSATAQASTQDSTSSASPDSTQSPP